MRLLGSTKSRTAWGPISAVQGGLRVDTADSDHAHRRARPSSDSLHASAIVIESAGCTLLDRQGRACSRLGWDDHSWWARVDHTGLVVEQAPWQAVGLHPWLPVALAHSAHPLAPQVVLALLEYLRHRPTARATLARDVTPLKVIADLVLFEQSDLSLPSLHNDPVAAEVERAIDESHVLRFERRPYAGEPLPDPLQIAERAAFDDRRCASTPRDLLAERVRRHLHQVTPWPFAALSG